MARGKQKLWVIPGSAPDGWMPRLYEKAEKTAREIVERYPNWIFFYATEEEVWSHLHGS